MPIVYASRGKLRIAARAGEDVRLVEARKEALELRRDGNSYRQIAAIMEISPATAGNYVQSELSMLRDQTAEDTEALRDIEVQRCDDMLRHLGSGIRAGDVPSVMAAVKISERRAKLLGLDAPERKEITHKAITAEEAAKLPETDILKRLDTLRALAIASLPLKSLTAGAEAPIIDLLREEGNSDAEIDTEIARPAPKVSIDVRQFVSPPRQGPYAYISWQCPECLNDCVNEGTICPCGQPGPRSRIAPATEFEDDPA